MSNLFTISRDANGMPKVYTYTYDEVIALISSGQAGYDSFAPCLMPGGETFYFRVDVGQPILDSDLPIGWPSEHDLIRL